MHKLIEYICDELEELEQKAEHGKLSMAEVEYGDMLAHFKKNLLTADAMMDEDEYSYSYAYDDGMSMARGRGRSERSGRSGRRDSRGRYSRNSYGGGSYRYSRADAKEGLMDELRDLHDESTDENTKQMIRTWMSQLEKQ